MNDNNKIFEIENANENGAFCVTLKPTDGNKAPTMKQLYSLLGTVQLLFLKAIEFASHYY